MHIDRRALAGGAAALGAGISAELESDGFDEGVAVQRVYDGDGELVSVGASMAAGEAWVTLLARE